MVSGVKRLAFRKPKTCRKCFPKIEKKRRRGGNSDWAAFALEIEDCPSGEDSSQDGGGDSSSSNWDEEERRRICRCRQGRNHESREKVALVRMLQDTAFANNHIKEECWNCESTDIVFDYGRSEATCSDCGAVVADVVVWGDIDGALVRSKSKPYQTLVYMREKLRGLHGSDPEIWPEEWDSIVLRMQEVYGEEHYKSILERTLGPRTFAEICRSVEDERGNHPLKDKKYGERWIQARQRLGLTTPEPMEEELLSEIIMRTAILQQAHPRFFKNKITGKDLR